MLPLDGCKQFLNLIWVRYVTCQRQNSSLAQPGCSGFQCFRIPTSDHNRTAFSHESLCESKANPAAPAGDDGNLIFQHLLLRHLKGISVLSVANERQELLTRILRMTKAAQHMGGYGRGMLLLHATHH